MKFEQEKGEALALEGLSFLAQDPDRLRHFLNVTGVRSDEVRERYSDPEFLAGVLDYLLSDETLLIAFVELIGVDPTLLIVARQELPGAYIDV